MIGIDDLLKTLFQDVADAGRDTTPGELVRSSLAGQMPSGGPSGGGMSLPMALGGPRGMPRVPGPPPVPGPSLPSARSAPAPTQVAQAPAGLGGPAAAPQMPSFLSGGDVGNALTDFSQGYSSGGLIGAIGNLMQGPEKRNTQQAQRKQLYQTLIGNGMDPQKAVLFMQSPEAYNVLNPKEDLTGSQKEWKAAVQSGDYKGSFYDWQKEMKKLGSPQTIVDMKAESAWAKKRAELDAANVSDTFKKATAAQGQLQDLALMRDALRQYGSGSKLGTGVLAPVELNLRNLAGQLGIGKAKTLAAGDLVNALGNKMALFVRNPESGLGMPGALSERDITFLKATMPGLENSQAGNELIIDVYSKLQRRQIEVAKLMDAYSAQNNGLTGWTDFLDQWTEANPIVDDETAQRFDVATKEAKTQKQGVEIGKPRVEFGAPTATGPNGEKIILRNGKWEPL